MEPMDLEAARVLGLALAIGVLVGAERYRVREPGQQEPAGLRTFAVIGLLGGVCAVLGQILFAVVTFAAVASFVLVAYYRQSVDSLGATTEMAALLTFWLGYLVKTFEALAVGLAIVLAILLAAKRPMHDFVKGRISDVEFKDTLKFLAVVFVIYPLLPDRTFGPYDFLNARQIWTFVVIYSALSYAGYFLVRVFGSERGLLASALMGGLVSTPAVTVSLAHRSRESPAHARVIAAAAMMANAVQPPRLLVLVLIVDQELSGGVAPLLLAMFAVGTGSAWLLGKLGGDGEEEDLEISVRNPFSFAPALVFALVLFGFSFFARVGAEYQGEAGVYAVAALTGLASVSAVALAIPGLVASGGVTTAGASIVLLVAIAANAASKWVLALLNGTRAFAIWLGGGLLTIIAAGLLYLALAPA